MKVLEGAASVRGGECSLFIDIIGMPRTPHSCAGAERRYLTIAKFAGDPAMAVLAAESQQV